jgi:FKBP-type peptidyl-prolyl cis-trans isomerase FkpA
MSHLTKRWLAPAGFAILLTAAPWAGAETPAAGAPAAGAPAAAHPSPKPHAALPAAANSKSEDQKTVYEMGVLLSRGLDTFQLSEAEFDALKAGLSDGFHQRAGAAEANAWMPKVQALQRNRVGVAAQREKEAGQAYLAKAATAPGAQRMAGGLLYIPLAPGSGASPTASDEVKVNYEGRLIDGTVFDSSIKHGQPANLSVAGVIPCWTEALKVMKVGGKSRIVCPSDLAYGDRGALPLIRPGATLEFDVELLEVHPATSAADTKPAEPGANMAGANAPGAASGTK